MNHTDSLQLSGYIACQSWPIIAKFCIFKQLYWLNQVTTIRDGQNFFLYKTQPLCVGLVRKVDLPLQNFSICNFGTRTTVHATIVWMQKKIGLSNRISILIPKTEWKFGFSNWKSASVFSTMNRHLYKVFITHSMVWSASESVFLVKYWNIIQFVILTNNRLSLNFTSIECVWKRTVWKSNDKS
jgi:hypothetical protein